MARLATMIAGEAKVRAGDELTRARDAVEVVEEDGRGLEAEVVLLSVERMSLLQELEESRDEVSALHSQAGMDKEAMVEDYQEVLEQIFAYGYGCCVFKHDIRSDQPRIPDGMPDFADSLPTEFFFFNLGCPLVLTLVEVEAMEVHLVETRKDLVEGIIIEEHGQLFLLY